MADLFVKTDHAITVLVTDATEFKFAKRLDTLLFSHYANTQTSKALVEV